MAQAENGAGEQKQVMARWEFRQHLPDEWRLMGDNVSSVVEQLYQDRNNVTANSRPIITIGRCGYELDFGKMLQRNMRSGRTRGIRRVEAGNPQDVSATASNGIRFPLTNGSGAMAQSPRGSIHDSALRAIFLQFCGSHVNAIDCRGFVKLCRDCGLIDSGFRETDADLVFAAALQHGQRRLELPRFEGLALKEVARRKGVDFESVCGMVLSCSGPQLRATSPQPVRQHDNRVGDAMTMRRTSSAGLSSRTQSPRGSRIVSPRASVGAMGPMTSMTSMHSMASSPRGRGVSEMSVESSMSSRRPRVPSPGPGDYGAGHTSWSSRHIKGGGYFGTGHRLDLGLRKEAEGANFAAPASRSRLPSDSSIASPVVSKLASCSGFGTGHMARVARETADIPGPGAYKPSKPREHVKGGAMSREHRDTDMAFTL
eukprot:TRINITY_DN52499_c0_g1_i1.p1 TRINITY_DN52499_c0_g1~~TRINITY_DN52499_c0_g1_i1.p1  ORF type:complete len:428 (-),score=58.83 TRINITY_DN52499_c0_g1_i1:270-1553(-)